MDFLPLILTLFGTLGVGGAIALWFLAPALFGVIAEMAGKLLAALLGSRIGCALLAAVLAAIAADLHRHHTDKQACAARFERAQAEAEAERVARDAEITRTIEQKYAPELAQLDARAKTLQQQVADYESEKHSGTGARCQLGAEPLRLRKHK